MYSLAISSINKVVTCPLERIRMLRQVQGQYLLTNRISRKSSNLEWAKDVINKEGYVSFFKGGLLEVIRGFPFQLLLKNIRITLSNLNIFKIKPRKDSPAKKQIKTHLVGTLATSLAYILTAPLNTISTRISGSIPSAINPVTTLSVVKDLFASPINFLSSFNGIIPCIVSATIHKGLYVVIYDFLKEQLGTKGGFWLSSLTFLGVSQLIYPGDTIRNHAMVSNGLDITGIKAARSIFKHEGLVGFFGGAELAFVRGIVTIAVIAVGDHIYGKFNAKKEDKEIN